MAPEMLGSWEADIGTQIIVHCDDRGDLVPLDLTSAIHEWVAKIDAAFPDSSRIGLIAPTGVAVISCWKGILLSGRVPILLHYPTEKLSRTYWNGEIENAVAELSIDAIVHYGALARPSLSLPCLDLLAPGGGGRSPGRLNFADGRVIQLSSGTTGFRKGIALSMADIARHIGDYNAVLDLGPEDCIVSWLPLYHDMGFIACFLMPLLTGARAVMVDPMIWVRRPQLLFELIERHHGTVCFMPNFGFQLMATRGCTRQFDLSSMRRWISCSEPTRIDTVRRFVEVCEVAPELLSNCYGMAENVFAIAQSDGFRTRNIDGHEIVSCGRPIPNTSLKIVEGEVRVRSPYSLRYYEGGQSAVDVDGYYATGDMGEIVGGELYLLGRKHEILVQAGRKFFLADLDHRIGQEIPESAGRICVTDHYNEALGTDEPICLIEHERFWSKMRNAALIAEARDRLGLETAKIEFVPPGFLTKTSSGKMSRARTRDDYLQLIDFRRQGRVSFRVDRDSLRAQILEIFPGLLPNVALREQLDSLGLVNLSIVLEAAKIEMSPERALDDLLPERDEITAPDIGPVLRVACWVDDQRMSRLAIKNALTDLVRGAGVHVHCRFIAAPPAPIVLSDLVFEDYFMAREPRREAYAAVKSVLGTIRDADLIITDDIVQILFPSITCEPQSYPRISHRSHSSDLAQFLGVRWTMYSENHHHIATEVVHGCDLTPEIINRSLDDLEDYLKIPIIRLSVGQSNFLHTASWQIRCFDKRIDGFPFDQAQCGRIGEHPLKEALSDYLSVIFPTLELRSGTAIDKFVFPEQPHFCGTLVNPALVDFVLEQYDSFLVLGKRSSIPYLANRASDLGKRLTYRYDLSCPPNGDYECVLQTGSFGDPDTEKPIFQLYDAGWTPQVRNVPPEVVASCPPWLWTEGVSARP